MGALPQCCFNDGPHFSALWRCGNSVVSVHHINNFWNTRFKPHQFSGQSLQWLRMVFAKLHVKRLRIDWDINEKRSADVVTTLVQCFALITFEVLNQTPPNLLGSCRSSSRWCLQNYIKNGWELTSELTSKWIIYWNTQTNFKLISLITFEVLAQTLQTLQDSGHNTIWWCLQNYMEDGWEFTSELTSKWITFEILNQISHWSQLITFEVLSQTLQNLQGSRRNTIQWCLQNYMVNGWELTSELTSKWIYILKYSSKFTTNLTNNFRSTRSNFTEFTGQSLK